MTDIKKVGSRAQVMHGNAIKTTGGLTKKQLKYNKQGKIVSRKASTLAKQNNRLVKAGYVTKKGQFGVKMKGGGKNSVSAPATPLLSRPSLFLAAQTAAPTAPAAHHPNARLLNQHIRETTQTIVDKTQIELDKVIGHATKAGINYFNTPSINDNINNSNSIYKSYNKMNMLSKGLLGNKSNIYIYGGKVVIKRVKRVKRETSNAFMKNVVNELRTLIIARAYNIPSMCRIISHKFEYSDPVYAISIAMKKYEFDLMTLIDDPSTPFTDRSLDYIIRQIINVLTGINELHKVGIAHCDIKPENIFVSDDMSWYVGDFDSSIFMEDGKIGDQVLLSEDYRPIDLIDRHGFFDYDRTTVNRVAETTRNFECNKSSIYKSIDMYSIGYIIFQILGDHTKNNTATNRHKYAQIDIVSKSLTDIDRSKFLNTQHNESLDDVLPTCIQILEGLL